MKLFSCTKKCIFPQCVILLLHYSYCHCCFLQFCIYEKLRSSKIDRDRIIIVVLHMQTSFHDDFSKLEFFQTSLHIGNLDTFLHAFASKKSASYTVFENHRKSHSTLRAKRATFTSWLKMPKVVNFGDFLKT